MAKLINNIGYYVFATFITPTSETREVVKSIIPDVKFIYVDTPLATCENRDDRGMYKKARNGEIKGFTGIDDPFEPMKDAWITIDTSEIPLEENIEKIINKIKQIRYGNF